MRKYYKKTNGRVSKKAYSKWRQKPESKKRRAASEKERYHRPDVRERRLAYNKRPDVRARENKQQKERNAIKRDNNLCIRCGVHSETWYCTSCWNRHSWMRKARVHVFERDKQICQLCFKKVESIEDAEADHIYPTSRGGPDTFENVRLTHRSCNRSRWVHETGGDQLWLLSVATL